MQALTSIWVDDSLVVIIGQETSIILVKNSEGKPKCLSMKKSLNLLIH